ncbi:MAG: phosphoglycerate dehydrogenase [Pseudomonadota bacterium]
MVHPVLLTDNVHGIAAEMLRDRAGFEVDVRTGSDPQSLKKVIGKYEAVVIRSTTKITADVIQAADNLKVIVRAGSGTDNIDTVEATKRGVVVMNTPGGNSQAAAEHALGLILALHRHIAPAVESLKAGRWEKKKFQGHEIAGRTLGVLGLGRIGGIVAARAAKGLKMRVLAYDPAVTPETMRQMGIESAGVEEIFSRADVITVHIPLNDSTRGLIDSGAIGRMKPGVMLVNTARGGIIDEDALFQGLESGKVAAAALDVFSVQPPGKSPLIMHPRVVATPHLGASTAEAQVNVAVSAAEQIIEYLEDGVIRNAVNAPALQASDLSRVGPYLRLAGKLARFVGSLCAPGVSSVDVEYFGQPASWDLRPMTNSALVGLLSSFHIEHVNHINAASIAKERGIGITETARREGDEYPSSIGIKIRRTDGSVRSVHGAVFRRQGDEPRITEIDGFVTEAVPSGPMLVVTNRDVPGMIAAVAGALAAERVNIAQMNLSREKIGGKAISIINTDQPAGEKTLAGIRRIDGILSVDQVIMDD